MPRVHRGRRCFVKSCPNYQHDHSREPGELRFFAVPDDVTIREEFKQICGRSGDVAKFSVICSRHFTSMDLTKAGHLRRGALPTLNLVNEGGDLDSSGVETAGQKRWKGNRCAVQGCRSYTGDRHTMNIHFFYCPQKELSEQSEEAMDLYNKWFTACGRTDIEQFSKYHRVCSLHFDPEDVDLDTGRAKLRPTGYPKRYLPGGEDGEPPEFMARTLNDGKEGMSNLEKVLHNRLLKSCNDQWRIVRNPYFKPPLPEGHCPWNLYEREETHVSFCRVRKAASSQLLYSAVVDFIQFDSDMNVSLHIGTTVIELDKYGALLTEGKASTQKQVEDIFCFDFSSCEVVMLVGPISVVDQAFLASLGNNVFVNMESEAEENHSEQAPDAAVESAAPNEDSGNEDAYKPNNDVTDDESSAVLPPRRRRTRKPSPAAASRPKRATK